MFVCEKKHVIGKNEVINISSDESDDVVIVGSKDTNTMKLGNKASVSATSENDWSDDLDISLNFVSYDSDGQVSDVNTGVVVKWKKVVSPNGWTNEMRRYYNKPCKRQRYFDWRKELVDIRNGPPSSWDISHRDLYPDPVRKRRCLICRQPGHLSKNCPKKSGTCSMCGVTGHLRYNCPKSICLNCGIRQNTFSNKCRDCSHWWKIKCNDCKNFGHKSNNCPNLWRRFHSTTDFQELQSSQTSRNENIQCCNCAQSGHLYEDCTQQYFTSDYGSFIHSMSAQDSIRSQNRNRFKRSHSFTLDSSDEAEVNETKIMRYGNHGHFRESEDHWNRLNSSDPFQNSRIRSRRPKKKKRNNGSSTRNIMKANNY